MTRALLAIIALGLCSCATPRVAPRFDVPSTQPIAQAHKKAAVALKSAQAKTKKLEQEVAPNLKIQVASIEADQDTALKQLDLGEGARKQLQTQLKEQTGKANTLAKNYDTAQLQIASLEVSRHRYVMLSTYLSIACLVAGAWIFRKPILMLVAGL